MLPFGMMHGQRVFGERCFVGEPEMVFNTGTHTDSLCMHYRDLADIVRPIVGSLGVPPFARRMRVPKYRARRVQTQLRRRGLFDCGTTSSICSTLTT